MSINRDQIAKAVERAGLEFIGVAPLDLQQDFLRYKNWLEERRHASMTYMERYQEVREDPRLLFPEGKSCVVIGLCYAGEEVDAEAWPKVAKYARFKDYHKVLKVSGEGILRSLQSLDIALNGRVLVDTAPLLERAVAAKTKSVFVGKNTLAIHSQRGSFLLLAEIILDAAIVLDNPNVVDHSRRDPELGGCGTCKRCQVHCPTGALDEDYRLDANRCLSYWTIEHRGEIPTEFWPYLTRYWYGCDICQDVCPYNREAKASTVMADLPKRPLPSLDEVARMSQRQYEEWFGGLPMTRARRAGLMRNALIALYQLNHPEFEAAFLEAKAAQIEDLEPTLLQLENL